MIGVDLHPEKVSFINKGRPTIIEKDVDALMAEQHAVGRISATHDAVEAVHGSDVSFICVGTPSTANGHLDLTAIRKVAAELGRALKTKGSRHVFALRSTVLPGTNEEISTIIAEESGLTSGVDFSVVSNPEFLREGSSVADFDNPPFTLVGSECDWAVEVMRDVYKNLDAPFIVTKRRIAELMKYVCNSFHALKITFGNEVGNICKKLGIDSHELMDIFCQDERLNISKAYLKPGFAYGGSCLPKDLKALCTIAHDHYLETPVLDSIARSNEIQKDLVLQRILDYGHHNVSFLGLAFKAGTDDLRESPIVDVIERLLGKGFKVKVYDPHVHVAKLTGANRDYILQKIPFIAEFITNDLSEVLDHGETIVVVNRDPAAEEVLDTLQGGKQVLELARNPQSDPVPVDSIEGLAW
jgi:GDP-mannose 6-dehydrogenase